MGEVGRSQVRVDAYDKATGRTKYYEDQMPQDALYVRIKHAEIAHGFVKSVDTAAAEAIAAGVYAMIPLRALSLFTWEQLERAVKGVPEVPMELWSEA